MTARRSHGFTIIETLAAVVILTIAVPPMLWAINAAHVQRVDPVMTSRARWLAVEKLEDIIADRNSSTRGFSYLTAGNYPAEGAVTGFAAFSRTVTLLETDADLVSTVGNLGYMNIDVAVTWKDGTATSRTLTIATVVTDYPL
jgi:prepilin-type N-terminal cleavage/methylation domain-containing protein